MTPPAVPRAVGVPGAGAGFGPCADRTVIVVTEYGGSVRVYGSPCSARTSLVAPRVKVYVTGGRPEGTNPV